MRSDSDGMRDLAGAFGTQVLRIEEAGQISRIDDWVHDAYLEDAVEFSADARRAVIPFAQERGWGTLHPSMPDPSLVKKTIWARHYQVPLTRCYLVVNNAESCDVDIDWGNPSLLEGDLSDSTFRLRSSSFATGVAVRVSDVDLRVFVSDQQAGLLYRRVLRGWLAESDRWENPPP